MVAIVRIPLSFDLEVDGIFDKVSATELAPKQINEVLAGSTALKPWRAALESSHGALRAILSCSNPDDPPDLIFEFESRSLTVEISEVNPHPYGQAQAIHRKELPFASIALPAISIPYQTKSEIRLAMTSKVWLPVEAVGDRQRHLLQVTVEQIRRKTFRLMSANVDLDILLLYGHCPGLGFDSDTRPLVNSLAAMRKLRTLYISEKTLLLVHSQANDLRFKSFKIDGYGQVMTRSKGHE